MTKTLVFPELNYFPGDKLSWFGVIIKVHDVMDNIKTINKRNTLSIYFRINRGYIHFHFSIILIDTNIITFTVNLF